MGLSRALYKLEWTGQAHVLDKQSIERDRGPSV